MTSPTSASNPDVRGVVSPGAVSPGATSPGAASLGPDSQSKAPPPVPDIAPVAKPAPLPPEVGGAPGPEPTRYGDWQHKGRVTDF